MKMLKREKTLINNQKKFVPEHFLFFCGFMFFCICFIFLFFFCVFCFFETYTTETIYTPSVVGWALLTSQWVRSEEHPGYSAEHPGGSGPWHPSQPSGCWD